MTTLDNFDEERPPQRFGTPRSNEACELCGIEPRDLRRRSLSEFKHEGDHADLVYERHCKKVAKMLKEARAERNKIVQEEEDELDFSRTMEEDRARQEKIDKEYESKRRAIEIRLQNDLRSQKKVAMKNEKIKQAEAQKRDCLQLERKRKLNAKKEAQAQYARDKANKDREERARKEAERQNLQKSNLNNLDKKRNEEARRRDEAAHLRQKRFQDKTEEVGNQIHYRQKVKEIQNLKKEKEQRERDRQRALERERKKKEHYLIELEAKERNERLRKAKMFKDKRRMDKERKKEQRRADKKKLKDELRAQALAQERLLADDLKQEKAYIEQTCLDVRNWGLGQVKSQMAIINKWKVKSKSPTRSFGGRSTRMKKANNSDGVLLPPLPSSKSDGMGGSAKMSPRPPAAARA